MAEKHPAAIALEKWFESDEGKKCCEGTTVGEFLRNRLYRAFMAGWQGCGKEIEKQIKKI